MDAMTLGVEEEFLVVDAETGELVPRSHELVPPAQELVGDEVGPELNLCQIETGTPVCSSLPELRGHLRRLRRGLASVAADLDLGITATGTHPYTSWRHQQIDLRNDRYSRMDDVYQIVARQQVICGCHVHVGIDEPEVAVAVMNRVRPWLAVLLALSANSPLWQGIDTGYGSYRLQVWQRWPTSGMPPDISSRAEFDRLVGDLEAIDAIEDATFLYWYVRPSIRYPTLEFRICDVCLHVDDTMALAGLIRALAWTTAREVREERPAALPAREVMDAATWRAGRYGLDDCLVSPVDLRLRPAAEVVSELLDHVREGLEAHGDWDDVQAWIARILRDGNGASRQREALARRGDTRDVLAHIASETVPT